MGFILKVRLRENVIIVLTQYYLNKNHLRPLSIYLILYSHVFAHIVSFGFDLRKFKYLEIQNHVFCSPTCLFACKQIHSVGQRTYV